MKTNLLVPTDLRPIEPGDFDFVLNSWLMSYREYVCGPKIKNPDKPIPLVGPRAVNPERYYVAQQALISELSKRRRFVMACDPDKKDFIMGWICGEQIAVTVGTITQTESVVDYVYVKNAYRKMGMARTLLERGLGWRGEPILATHWTIPIYSVAQKYKVSFDDYLLKLGNSDVQAAPLFF